MHAVRCGYAGMVMMMMVVVDVMQLSRLSVWVSDTLVIFDSLLFFHTKVLMYTGDRDRYRIRRPSNTADWTSHLTAPASQLIVLKGPDLASLPLCHWSYLARDVI